MVSLLELYFISRTKKLTQENMMKKNELYGAIFGRNEPKVILKYSLRKESLYSNDSGSVILP